MTPDDTTFAHDDLPGHHGSRRRRARRRSRHHRHLPALPGAGGRLLGPARRGGRRRGRHLVLEPLPRVPLRLGELHLRLPVLPRAVRRVGVEGALRPPARDRALPQPCGRPLRPAPPHALRRPGHRRRVRRAVGHLAGDPRRRPSAGEREEQRRDPGQVPHRRHRRAVGPLHARRARSRRLPGRGVPHRAVAGRAGRLRGQAGRRRRDLVERRAGRVRPSSTTSRQLTVYQRTANWCTPLNNTPITPGGAAAAAGRLRGAARDAEHVDQRLRPPGERRAPRSTTRPSSARRSTRGCGTAPAS